MCIITRCPTETARLPRAKFSIAHVFSSRQAVYSHVARFLLSLSASAALKEQALPPSQQSILQLPRTPVLSWYPHLLVRWLVCPGVARDISKIFFLLYSKGNRTRPLSNTFILLRVAIIYS